MYSKAIVFFAFLAMAVANDTSDSNPFETRVVGGKPATKGQYPFIVSLQQTMGRQSRHFCAASILNERWVLSAAHCGKGIPASRITVKAGKNNLKVKEATEQTVKVLKVYIHEKYKGGVGPYDIALFKLATPLKMNKNVQAITLAQPNSIPTGNVWLCGWGSTSTSIFPIMPDKLQHVMLNIMNLKSCNQTIIKLTGSSSVDKTNICTGSPDRKSSCSGDSGGPLFKIINKKPVLVGIVSWGVIPCGSRGAPSVYTRVSNYNNWIAQKMPRLEIDRQMPPVRPHLSSFQTRVVGGDLAPKGMYTWIGSLQMKTLFFPPQHFCGASILNEQWILTAAHCAAAASANTIFKAGKYNLKITEPTEQTVKVLKTYIHEGYKGNVGGNDIALMKLATPLKFNEYVKPIALPKPNSEPTGDVWLSGWGSTSTTNFPIMPSKLQHVMMHIIDRKSCDAKFTEVMGSPSPVDETNICTGPLSSKPNSACSGDSGGPLASFKEQKWELSGVVSWGMMPCGSPGMPSVFAKVSNYIDWITKKMQDS